MSLIDSTYFTGEILITNKSAISVDLTQAITQYEKEILISLLGYELYKLVTENQNDEPYKSLIEGAEFELTFNGITQTLKWEGLKNSIKESLIAYYVYYKYQERNYIQNTGVGTVQASAENSELVSPYSKMVNAWNKMIELYGWFPNYWFISTQSNILQPTGVTVYDNNPSAFNYISANIEDFPQWIFKPLRTINAFGI